MDDKLMPSKAKKIDELRKQKLLEQRQDRMVSDMQKQASTPLIKDSTLSTQDVHHVKSKSAPIDTKQIEKLTSGADFTDKIAKLRALKSVGKKALGVIPLVGTGMAMMDSPAASASEMMQDPKVQRAALSELAGPVGDAIDMGGDAVEYGLDKYRDSKDASGMIKAENEAANNYRNSQAYRDRRGISEEDADIDELQDRKSSKLARLKALMDNR